MINFSVMLHLKRSHDIFAEDYRSADLTPPPSPDQRLPYIRNLELAILGPKTDLRNGRLMTFKSIMRRYRPMCTLARSSRRKERARKGERKREASSALTKERDREENSRPRRENCSESLPRILGQTEETQGRQCNGLSRSPRFFYCTTSLRTRARTRLSTPVHHPPSRRRSVVVASPRRRVVATPSPRLVLAKRAR